MNRVILTFLIVTLLSVEMTSVTAFSFNDFFMGCPARQARDPLSPSTSNKISGKWYKFWVAQPSFIATFFQCSTLTLTQVDNSADTFNFEDKQILPLVKFPYYYKGRAIIDNFRRAKLKCSGKFLGMNMEVSNQILATDFENFTIVSTCKDFGYFHLGTIFVLTRYPRITWEDGLRPMKEAIKTIGMDLNSFSSINQEHC